MDRGEIMEKKYKHKSLTFDPDDKKEMKLWEWLQKQPHGKFAADTKKYWMNKMKEDAHEKSQ